MKNVFIANLLFVSALFVLSSGAQTNNTVTKIEGKYVYLSHGAKMNVENDEYYKTYREVTVTIDKAKGIVKKDRIETAILRIVEIGTDFSRAKILKNKGIALGDLAAEAPCQTRFAIVGGYSMFSISGKVNKTPSPIAGTITPDFSYFNLPTFMYGAFLGVDFCKIQNTKIGTKFLFNLFPSCGDLQGFSMDLSVYYKFTLPDPRLTIPAGLGVSMSRIRYEYKYSSYFVNKPDDYLKQYFGGAFVYTGLDYSFSSLFHAFVNVGFRYQEANKGWSVRYKTGGKNDVFGYDTKENYEIPSEYQAVNDLKMFGLDLKAGISFVF